jgi:protein SCO1/2
VIPVATSRRLVVLAIAIWLTTACAAESPAQDNADDAPAVVTELNPGTLHGTLLDPPMLRPRGVLKDTSGARFSLADRPEDELTVLFFGYTHCPDMCPTTMADLASARSRLPGELRDRVQVVFVTEDPKRDTGVALRRWLDRIDPSFVGLRGGNKAADAMLEQLYLPATKQVPNPETPIQHPDSGDGHHHAHGTYGIEHASVVYAFGPAARAVIYTGGTTAAEYAEDFARLLDPDADVR